MRIQIVLLCALLSGVSAFVPATYGYGYRAVLVPFAKQATKGGGGDKVRVKLLLDVKDTGRKGETVMVSAALWTNVLAPRKSAVRVSDEELASADRQEHERLEKELANAKTIEALILAAKVITFKRKVGQNKQLFGAVTGKQILEQLKVTYPSLPSKTTLETIVAEDTGASDSLVNGEIRKSGQYRARVVLHPKVVVAFVVDVVSEAS
jgi:ribosomal protein L9